MARINYTTVKQMGEKVDKLYDLLYEARCLAVQLCGDNTRNRMAIHLETPEALAEVRPLSMEERYREASAYRELFQKVINQISEVETLVSNNY